MVIYRKCIIYNLISYNMKLTFYIYLLFLFSLLLFSFKEGFELNMPSVGPSIGEYQYLNPNTTATVLDADTQTEFTRVWNVTTAFLPEWNLEKTPALLNSLMPFATIDEFIYYSKNKKWPYGSYITKYLKNNTEDVLKIANKPTITTTDQIQQIYSTRYFYALFILPTESKQNPQPVSFDIFAGRKNNSVSTDVKGLSSENMTKLKSVCSSI